MSIKTILVPFMSANFSTPALETAIKLAKAHSAHILALHVRPDPAASMPYVVGPMPTEMLVQLSDSAEEQGRTRAAKAKAAFEDICQKQDIKITEAPVRDAASVSWREEIGSLDFLYGVEAQTCDLAIVSQPKPPNADIMTDILEGVLFQSGRPILMLPETTNAVPGKKPVLAWNGSIEATRAIAASLPLIRNASEVTVLTVGQLAEDGPDGDAVAKYLVQHGIPASARVEAEEDGSESSQLLATTHALGADLLIMGAYSHSRLREMILGGMTNDIIGDADIPVLLMH